MSDLYMSSMVTALLQDAKMKKPILGIREQVRLTEKALAKLMLRSKFRITPKN